jgi:hypothetical protein
MPEVAHHEVLVARDDMRFRHEVPRELGKQRPSTRRAIARGVKVIVRRLVGMNVKSVKIREFSLVYIAVEVWYQQLFLGELT